MVNLELRNKVRYFRKQRNLSQTALSALSDVSQTTISDIENGQTPGVDIALKLSLALDVPMEKLFYLVPVKYSKE